MKVHNEKKRQNAAPDTVNLQEKTIKREASSGSATGQKNLVNHIFSMTIPDPNGRFGNILSKIFPVNSRQRHFLGKIYRFLFGDPDKIMNSKLYRLWIINNEPSVDALAEQRQEVVHWSQRPCISIVTPIYKTPLKILRAMIESVTAQTYPEWELCLANGSPDIPEICSILDEYAEKDNRIKVIALTKNRGIAGNTNAAIAIAQGEFIGFLDHDDLLAPFALYSVAKTIIENRHCDLLYSDEDKISEDGTLRFAAFFKPAFSPDYLRTNNYICHFLTIRKTLGDQVGWIHEGFEGAQDYDLILRVSEEAREIAHIPQILYHWRAMPGSTALTLDSKSYASQAGIKALNDHLQRSGMAGTAMLGVGPTTYRIICPVREQPLVSIIIPNQDHADDLQVCVNSILERTSYQNFEILIVENGSQEEKTFALYETFRKEANIRVIQFTEPFNFSTINNFAVKHAKGEVLMFLNNDTRVINFDWIERLLEFSLRLDVGITGAKLCYSNDTIQHAGVLVGFGGIAGHINLGQSRAAIGYGQSIQSPRNLSAVSAACLMIRKKVFYEIGQFDENYPVAYGDIDLCMKAKAAGYQIVWTPYAELYHYESQTRGYEDTPEKVLRLEREGDYFKQKWPEIFLDGDEYYNPNFKLDVSYEINPLKNDLKPRVLKGPFNQNRLEHHPRQEGE